MKRVLRFRETIELRRKRRDEIQLGWIAEAVKVTVETIEKKSRPEVG